MFHFDHVVPKRNMSQFFTKFPVFPLI